MQHRYRSICEYTGLDEKTLEQLHEFNLQTSIPSNISSLYKIDSTVSTLNQLFQIEFIQKLALVLTQLRTKSKSFMDETQLSLEENKMSLGDKSLTLDIVREYEHLDEKCDILSYKANRFLIQLLERFDEREIKPDLYKDIKQRLMILEEQIIDDNIYFGFKSDES